MKKTVFISAFTLMTSFNSAHCEPETQYELDTPPSEVVETPAESNSKIKDSITLSSAYFESQYTNKQLANFGLEVVRVAEVEWRLVVEVLQRIARVDRDGENHFGGVRLNGVRVGVEDVGKVRWNGSREQQC